MTKKEKITIIAAALVIVVVSVIIILSLLPNSKTASALYPDVDEIKLTEFGSCSRLSGKIAIVTIFADDNESKWDFSDSKDIKKREDIFQYLKISTEWLKAQAQSYKKEVEFSIPDSEDDNLYYHSSFNSFLHYNTNTISRKITSEKRYINDTVTKNINISDYDSIAYFIITNNESASGEKRAYSLAVYGELFEMPFELAYFTAPELKGINPVNIAHELLHLFGAPDLYLSATLNYKVSDDFVKYCAENYKDDIMVSTYILNKEGEKVRVFDSVPKEITEVTAYYLGWLDYIPDWVDEYKLLHNQFEYYDNLQKVN